MSMPLDPSAQSVPRLPGIYRIIDGMTGRFYVGSTINLRKRIEHHCYRLWRGDHANPILQAIWSSDTHRLTFHVDFCIEGACRDELLAEEQAALDAACVGLNRECMNILPVAGSHLGHKRSQETCEKLRAANIGRSFSAESREKMRQAKLGVPLSDAHRSTLSRVRKGKPRARPKGIINPELRRLSREDVIKLRKRRSEGASWKILSSEFGISKGAAKRAAIGETYQDVPI